ncbi:MAG: hypothetical protein K9H41_02495 [Bacteroidia bacterium]|nr:hypothetical protein [Bacteroidia bacterium]
MWLKIKDLLWKWKFVFIFLGLFIIVLTQRFLNERQNGLINSVSSDGLGYYCYLPAAIIYQDFTYSFYDKKENKISPFYKPYLNPYNDKFLNKYYCGTSICLLPFFATGVLISSLAGTQINGYTDTFLMLVSVAAILYFLFSIFLLSKVGKFFFISEKISFITSLIFFFGTNLFHYVIQEPSMSHVYSFFAVSLFLYCFMKLIQTTNNKNILMVGLAISLIALIRPVNILVILFTPFFFDNLREYYLFLKTIIIKHYKGLILLLLVVGFAVLLQFTFYYLQTGDFYIVSYPGETFNFGSPELFNVLFSYRKGLFIYVPILLAAVLFSFFSKNYWYKKVVFLITFFVFLYVTSSWWCWWYGEGFSIRPIVDFLPFFIIVSMFLVSKLSLVNRKFVLLICAPFLITSQIMAFQYSNLIMDKGEMNKEKFWDIFLETDLAAITEKKIDKIKKISTLFKTEVLNFENDFSDSRITNVGYKSKRSCKVNKDAPYSIGFGFPINNLNINESFYLIVECMAKSSKDGKNFGLDVSIDDQGNCVKWHAVYFPQFNKDEDGWVKMITVVEIESWFITDKNYFKVFTTAHEGENLVDNLKYSVYKKKLLPKH